MKLGEIGILTNDVIRLANFYKELLRIDNGSNDSIHQTIIGEETMLTIYNDGSQRNKSNNNICIVFTVEDVDTEFERLKNKGISIIEVPTSRPWGARNMSFYDPDHNVVYLRSFL